MYAGSCKENSSPIDAKMDEKNSIETDMVGIFLRPIGIQSGETLQFS